MFLQGALLLTGDVLTTIVVNTSRTHTYLI